MDNGDGTITDRATGLTWMKADNGKTMSWEQALRYAESLNLAGHDDWRLPNVKELQSLVDYTRSPGTTGSAAIDPLFDATPITNEAGQPDFAFYWSGSTHLRQGGEAGARQPCGGGVEYLQRIITLGGLALSRASYIVIYNS